MPGGEEGLVGLLMHCCMPAGGGTGAEWPGVILGGEGGRRMGLRGGKEGLVDILVHCWVHAGGGITVECC